MPFYNTRPSAESAAGQFLTYLRCDTTLFDDDNQRRTITTFALRVLAAIGLILCSAWDFVRAGAGAAAFAALIFYSRGQALQQDHAENLSTRFGRTFFSALIAVKAAASSVVMPFGYLPHVSYCRPFSSVGSSENAPIILPKNCLGEDNRKASNETVVIPEEYLGQLDKLDQYTAIPFEQLKSLFTNLTENQVQQLAYRVAFHIAINRNWPSLVKRLLKFKPQIDLNANVISEVSSPRRVTTLLNASIEAGRFEIVKILLQHDVNINQRDQYNQTPLLLALFKNEEICKIDPNPGCFTRFTARIDHYFTRRECVQMASLLIEHDAKFNYLELEDARSYLEQITNPGEGQQRDQLINAARQTENPYIASMVGYLNTNRFSTENKIKQLNIYMANIRLSLEKIKKTAEEREASVTSTVITYMERRGKEYNETFDPNIVKTTIMGYITG